jgi:lysophospholipase L1-like esterase
MTGTVLPEGTAIAAVATVGFDYATWLGAEENDDGGLHCRNQWSSIDDYVPDAGIWLPQYSTRSPYTFTCGWEPISLVSGGAAQELWPGIVDACLNSACVDGGHAHNPLQTISGSSEIIEIGGHQNNVDWNSQPNAIIKGPGFDSQAHKSIFLYGDSIVGGAHPQETIHNMMWLREGAAASVQNHAQSGYTIEQCKTAWDNTVNAVRAHPYVACNTYMMVQCGTNSPDDAGYTFGLLQQMLASGQDAGIHVCGSTLTPRDDHCPYVLSVNARLQAWGPTVGVPIADTFNTPLWSGSSCTTNQTYYDDSVHPNDAGTVIEVNTWIPACGW